MRGTACCVLSFQATLCICGCLLAAPTLALPPGRAWAPTVRLDYPGVSVFGGPRLETDADGVPLLVIGAQWDTDPAYTWNVLAWRESTWVSQFVSDMPAFFNIDPALSLTDRRFIVWVSPEDPFGYARVVMSELGPNGFGPPDTAMVTTSQSWERTGAVSRERRWVARSHQPPNLSLHVRVGYFDLANGWHDLPNQGLQQSHVTMAPLSDSSAILVHAGLFGLGWAVVEGDRWTREGNLDPRSLVAHTPRLRFRPSGGLWLLWTERPWVHVSEYRNGEWSRGDSLTCVHPDGGTYSSAWCDLSRDPAERPVLAWGDLGIRSVGCVAFPTDSGWMPGEEIPGSERIFLTPYVARDRNGDVWTAWRLLRMPFNRWTHTYVTATTSRPEVVGAGPHRVVQWTLSEPAPESWWAVLRARGRGTFEQVVRIQAGPTTEMTWSDPSPPGGVLRYRIRRESVDSRYRWESEEAWWPPPSARPLVLSRREDKNIEFGRLELTGAEPGLLEVRLYDVQGRLVLRQPAVASGSGRDTIRLDLAAAAQPLGVGIYFATVRDGIGRTSDPVRLVVLR